MPYVRVDGAQVAADYAALASGTLEQPSNVTESGTTYSGGVWTAVLTGGSFSGSLTCNGWTDFTSNMYGGHGIASATNSAWTYTGTASCNSSLALYCIEQ